MINAGGRRMMRSIMIDLDSTSQLNDEKLTALVDTYFSQDLKSWLSKTS